ncbi:inositol-tetrakisphosphate 1-kinase [Triplophysa rosa]|uniref:Inositol-tetrakisphosphate 1-kinase n=1 Tax=Triplophysa rosa TaxID=992332 RepID=A0A9W7TPY4_TRIRA|nr:inositol-tetrakisphosphate 1-kinase [Triplophysa rosa]KAI7799854.1 inositol-tetrakisphosphate 1-kinase [Triplophysa rosa]
MQTFVKGKRVGYWLSEKKIKKLNFQTFVDMCRKQGIEMIQLDLSQPIEKQGPFDVIIHKLTDHIVDADQNVTESLLLVQGVQDYIDAHPETVILDPLPAIRTLLDRCKSYKLIQKIEDDMQDDRICSPPFMVLKSECNAETLEKLHKNGITFPFICKPQVAHGTNSHEMAIIFSEEDLTDIKPPCVIQSFINHNAVLYKVFIVGEAYSVVQRPSIRNFPSGPTDRRAISFNSHHVSKPESSSHLTCRDNMEGQYWAPNNDVIQKMSRRLREALSISLFGIDIIINNQTGQHAVIDINAFPGYEGVPAFFDDLLSHITSVLRGQVSSGASCGHLKANGIGQNPSVACGMPCGMLGNESSCWLMDSEGIKKGSHQGRSSCGACRAPNFHQHARSGLAAAETSSQ